MIKVAITGPESTGKSWLAQNLASFYKTEWVKEFAREHIGTTGRNYTLNDIIYIAENQIFNEKRIANGNHKIIFSDTEMMVCKIWSEVKFGYCPEVILSHLRHQYYDLYLLCNIDLPWEEDPQREHPDLRKYLFDRYYMEMLALGWNFRVVSGTGLQRLENAIKFVEEAYSTR